MATDFFDRQDAARRNTARLVILFALAVLAIIASIHLLLAAVFGFLAADERTGAIDWGLLFDPGLLSLAVLGTAIVVTGGSLYKIAQLRGGGRVIAEQLGGRLISPDTTNLGERQLMNVVEEMAIASGTTVPPVYLLEGEEGINAFAAGFTPDEAVLGVTKGAVERLSRDELQGVIGHEFSHILNGDMRLNIRLIGLLHGILIIGMMGYFILRMSAFSGGRRSRDRGNPMPIVALGAGLAIVGFFGTFFGNLIKAAVSRQREFLADAAAVQFTRNPSGIAGALKKIGGTAAGSNIRNPNAPEASHMFFGRAAQGFSALFSTHPRISERIRRLDPSWTGAFDESAEGVSTAAPPPAAAPSRAAGPAGARAPGAPMMAGMAYALAHIGRPGAEHIDYAGQLLASLPEAILNAAHEPYGARALVYAMLLDRDLDMRRRQLQQLERTADPGVFEATLRFVPAVAQLETNTRLPVVEIALPALRSLTTDQYTRFKANVAALVAADEKLELFEWALQRILLHGLERHHGEADRPGPGHRALATLQPQCEVLFSALAHAGQSDDPSAARAFQQAWQVLDLPQTRMLSERESRLDELDRALDVLEEAAPQAKRKLIEAAVACIAADRQVTSTEAELLRVIAASLGVPVPPVLAA